MATASEFGKINHRATLASLVLLMAVTTVRLSLINRPFVANGEGTACSTVLMPARNYVRYGPSLFSGVLNSGLVPPERRVIYAHHPMLVPLLIAAVQAAGGFSEWTARAVPTLFSIASTLLLFIMINHRFGWRAAFLAGTLYAFCPMTLLYGGMPDYLNSQLVFFGLACIESYARWRETQQKCWLVALVICFVFGALTDWPIYYLVPLLAAHAVFIRPRVGLVRLLPFLVGAIAVFLAVTWQITVAGGDSFLLKSLAHRSLGNPDFSSRPLTVGLWISWVIFHTHGLLHTWPILVFAGLYVLVSGQRVVTRQWDHLPNHRAPLLVFLWGALHVGIGLQGNFQHEWSNVLMTPGLAVAAALGIEIVLGAIRDELRRPALQLATLGLICFLTYSAAATVRYIKAQYHGAEYYDYTLKELGTTIRGISREEDGVLTSDVNDWTRMIAEPPLWYYADRQLRPAVTTVEQLNQSLCSGPYILFYGYVQPEGPAPRWFVMPSSHRELLKPLGAALDARFQSRQAIGFVVYELNSPRVVKKLVPLANQPNDKPLE